MANDSTVFVELDVHKDSIVAAYSVVSVTCRVTARSAFWSVTSIGFARVCRARPRGWCSSTKPTPCGYGLQRYLSRRGFVCKVCAPSLIAKKAGDRVKTDRRDAERLVKALHMDDLSFVHVPDEHDEAVRDLVRAWGAAKEDLKKARQRLKGFLLVHGVRYSGHADWRDAHRRRRSEFTFPQAWSQLAFEEHRRPIEDRLAQCQRLEQVLREAAPAGRFHPVSDASAPAPRHCSWRRSAGAWPGTTASAAALVAAKIVPAVTVVWCRQRQHWK